MPLTVITVKNAPMSLKGDLTKWMQEIATGVYIGNFNSRVREKLWLRVKEKIGRGEATLSYYYRNEMGYDFDTINTAQQLIDYDGIPLVVLENKDNDSSNITYGFSNAAKTRSIRKFSKQFSKPQEIKNYVVIDIETDGLDEKNNSIIEIGAIKIIEKEIHKFASLIKNEKQLPGTIVELTQITDQMLKYEGESLESVLRNFIDFIDDLPIVGYNVQFDIKFINYKLNHFGLSLMNKSCDLLPIIKKQVNLSNYKLLTVAKHYGIADKIPHRALWDAAIIFELSKKLKENIVF